MGLAYLFARAADTIADTNLISREQRLSYLNQFRASLSAAAGRGLSGMLDASGPAAVDGGLSGMLDASGTALPFLANGLVDQAQPVVVQLIGS